MYAYNTVDHDCCATCEREISFHQVQGCARLRVRSHSCSRSQTLGMPKLFQLQGQGQGHSILKGILNVNEDKFLHYRYRKVVSTALNS